MVVGLVVLILTGCSDELGMSEEEARSGAQQAEEAERQEPYYPGMEDDGPLR